MWSAACAHGNAPTEQAASARQPDPHGNEAERDVFIYLSFRPSVTSSRIIRFRNSLRGCLSNVDFHVVTFDSTGTAGTRLSRFENDDIPQTTYNAASAAAMGYPNKVPGPAFLLKPGNCDIPILLFWRDHPEYRRYWVIEDDVEYTGDLGQFIERLGNTNGHAELACTHLRLLPEDWHHRGRFRPGSDVLPEDRPLRVCFLAFFCATAAALTAIDAAYRRGWRGHHEVVWPGVLDFAGMPIRDIGGRGPFVAPDDRDRCYLDHSPDDFRKLGSFGTLKIRLKPGPEREVLWHPVKPLPNWLVMRRKRFLSIARWYIVKTRWLRFNFKKAPETRCLNVDEPETAAAAAGSDILSSTGANSGQSMPPADRPLFSVIIPTRNRSALFAVALASVLEQRFRDLEVIVVNDGSSAEHEPRYRELVEAASGTARLLTLVRTERGHGPSYALNFGAAQARGEYLCFLDDDDQWTDPEHLGRAAGAIAANASNPDLILADQRAFRNGVPVERVVWIEDLKDRLRGASDAAGAYVVTTAELLRCAAHCHLNTTIASRAFFLGIGGCDEGQRYEPDRDFYLRAIDQAKLIKYLPFVVSRHNIPDPAAQTNVSTAVSELSKRLYQLRTSDKLVLFGTRPEMRRHQMRYRAYILKHIATEAARAGQFDRASYYAREALMTRFTLGWLGATIIYALRRRLSGVSE